MRKKVSKFTLYTLLFAAAFFIFCNLWVYYSTNDETSYRIENVKETKTALLLGTSKFLKGGHENAYYSNRIKAAVALYKAGKIKFIIVSGDNSTKDYNEPKMMCEDLVLAGIPRERIYLDYAGFRTLDSVVRCDKIFGQREVLVISQRFHNERAIFIAQSYGIKMKGFNAQDVSAYYGFKTNLREKFARVKVVLDLMFGTDPKFLGEKIKIG